MELGRGAAVVGDAGRREVDAAAVLKEHHGRLAHGCRRVDRQIDTAADQGFDGPADLLQTGYAGVGGRHHGGLQGCDLGGADRAHDDAPVAIVIITAAGVELERAGQAAEDVAEAVAGPWRHRNAAFGAGAAVIPQHGHLQEHFLRDRAQRLHRDVQVCAGRHDDLGHAVLVFALQVGAGWWQFDHQRGVARVVDLEPEVTHRKRARGFGGDDRAEEQADAESACECRDAGERAVVEQRVEFQLLGACDGFLPQLVDHRPGLVAQFGGVDIVRVGAVQLHGADQSLVQFGVGVFEPEREVDLGELLAERVANEVCDRVDADAAGCQQVQQANRCRQAQPAIEHEEQHDQRGDPKHGFGDTEHQVAIAQAPELLGKQRAQLGGYGVSRHQRWKIGRYCRGICMMRVETAVPKASPGPTRQRQRPSGCWRSSSICLILRKYDCHLGSPVM